MSLTILLIFVFFLSDLIDEAKEERLARSCCVSGCFKCQFISTFLDNQCLRMEAQ